MLPATDRRSVRVQCVPKLLRAYPKPQELPKFTGDTIAQASFIDQFVYANGGKHLLHNRAAIRSFHRWAGGDAGVLAADGQTLDRFARHQPKNVRLDRGARDSRLRYAAICARLLLYLEDIGCLGSNEWHDGYGLYDIYRATLENNGYPNANAVRLANDLGHAIVWCRLNRISKQALTEGNGKAFRVHRCLCGVGRRANLVELASASSRSTAWHRLVGLVSGNSPLTADGRFEHASRKPKRKLPPSGERFLADLQNERGLSQSTLKSYRTELSRWLAKLGEDGSLYTAQLIRDIFRTELAARVPGLAGRLVTVLRGYIGYRALLGDCSPALVKALVARRTIALTPIPPTVDHAVLRSIVEAMELRTATGLRNRAIFMLLLELGLRGGEVRGLRFEDLDFDAATIAIRGKGGRAAVVPMTSNVGDALIAYIEGCRPKAHTTAVFLSTRPPYLSLHPTAVSSIVHKLLKQHGYRGGGHVFRRSLATALLDQSASIEEIATVLRHAELDTARIYVRVSQRMLGAIAQPFGGAR